MKYKIATIPGDGIGPDVVKAAVEALEAVAARFGFELAFAEAPMGGAAIDEFGEPLPASVAGDLQEERRGPPRRRGRPQVGQPAGRQASRGGATGHSRGLGRLRQPPAGHHVPPARRRLPAQGLPRRGRPRHTRRARAHRRHLLRRARPQRRRHDSPGTRSAIRGPEIERLLKVGFDAATKRTKQAVRRRQGQRPRVVAALARDGQGHGAEVARGRALLHVRGQRGDAARARRPGQFDVIATSNMFGDILSDEASMVTGSIGMLASASIGRRRSAGSTSPSTVGSRHRGAGQGQSARDRAVGRPAPSPFAQARGRGARPSRRRCRRCSTRGSAARTSPRGRGEGKGSSAPRPWAGGGGRRCPAARSRRRRPEWK